MNSVKNSPKVNESEKLKDQTNAKDLDDYVLVFNKPTKDNVNLIQIPQSNNFEIKF